MQSQYSESFFNSLVKWVFLTIILAAFAISIADAQKLEDQPQLKEFTNKNMQIPNLKTPLSKPQVEELIKMLNSSGSKADTKGLMLHSSAISKGQPKDLWHKGIKNILTLEFLKIKTKGKKSFLYFELNSFKIGRMPFNAYAELEIPLENIFRDSKGKIYIDYSIGDNLRDINFIKVMGTKSRIKHFSFIYSPEAKSAQFYLHSLDKVAFMGKIEMSLFGKGKIL